MKITIDKDEWWPVYTADEITADTPDWVKKRPQAELTDEEWADYQRVSREFEAWQNKLMELPHED